MARHKKPRSREDSPDKSAETKAESPAESKPLIVPNPPRRNVPLVVISGALMIGWLIFLLVAALLG